MRLREVNNIFFSSINIIDINHVILNVQQHLDCFVNKLVKTIEFYRIQFLMLTCEHIKLDKLKIDLIHFFLLL